MMLTRWRTESIRIRQTPIWNLFRVFFWHKKNSEFVSRVDATGRFGYGGVIFGSAWVLWILAWNKMSFTDFKITHLCSFLEIISKSVDYFRRGKYYRVRILESILLVNVTHEKIHEIIGKTPVTGLQISIENDISIWLYVILDEWRKTQREWHFY